MGVATVALWNLSGTDRRRTRGGSQRDNLAVHPPSGVCGFARRGHDGPNPWGQMFRRRQLAAKTFSNGRRRETENVSIVFVLPDDPSGLQSVDQMIGDLTGKPKSLKDLFDFE